MDGDEENVQKPEPGSLRFKVLGPVVAERDGAVLDVGGAQRRAVLALLLLHANCVVSAEELIDALWGEAPPPACRTQLQGLVSGLRRALGTYSRRETAPIETKAPGYRLVVPPHRLDLEEFRSDVFLAREHGAVGDLEIAVDLYRTGLWRWHGAAFADVPYPVVRDAAAGLEDLRLSVTEERIDAEIALGRSRELAAELGTLVADQPLRERFTGQYMTVLARTGRTAEALAVFRDARDRLVEELGIEPSERLQSLHRSILTGQIGAEETTGPVRPRVPRQLPADAGNLVGREEALEKARNLLLCRQSPPASSLPWGTPSAPALPRLVVTGPGGVGKTAFANRLAHMVRGEFPDGQLHAHLGGSGSQRREPGAVLSRFLNDLGIKDEISSDIEDRAAMFRDLLADRRMLLVLDDVGDESQIRPLLPPDENCAVIATSRRRLAGLDGPAPLPLDVLRTSDGVDLLRVTAGADRVGAEPDEAADIVSLCGGLPLAIRTAGARLASRPNWSLEHMARRLADDRGRLDWLELGNIGVRASFAGSYRELTEEQSRLLRRLGLARTTEFPAWIPAALLDWSIGATERVLDQLVDVHLVEPADRGVTGPRYRLHDLVHLLAGEFAAEETPADRAAAVDRTLYGWLDLAATADDHLPHWYGLDPEPSPRWRVPAETHAQVAADPNAWFEEEHLALEAAVWQAADEQRADVAWPLAQHMSTFLDMRGHYAAWADVLRRGLHAAEQTADRNGVACMTGLLIDAEASQDHLEASQAYAQRALAAYQELSDEPFEPGWSEPLAPSRKPAELAVWEEALAAERRADDPLRIGLAAFASILARRHAGVPDGYLPLFEEARDAFRACDARLSQLWAIKNIGLTHLKQRRVEEASRCLSEGESILREIDAPVAGTGTAGDVCDVYVAQGRSYEAEGPLMENLRQARAHGHLWDEGRALCTIGSLRYARKDHQAALNAYLDALEVWRRLRAPSRVAHTARTLADIFAKIGDSQAAALFYAEHAVLMSHGGSPTGHRYAHMGRPDAPGKGA